MSTEPEQKPETTEQPVHEKSEAEVVLDLLRTFQADLQTARDEIQALREENKLLNVRVNKELPEQLDRAFKDISDNFNAITRGLEAIPHAQQSAVAAAAAQEKGGNSGVIEKVFDTILKAINGAGSEGGTGTLGEFDKEILKMTKQIQMITLKDVLKKSAKSAGIELVDHVVVNP